jgi:5-dehydro-4-deoxyglucarate dehydratase
MPHVALALFDAASRGDFARARDIFEEKVLEFYALRAKKRGYEVSSVKAAMEACGLPAGPVRPPLVELSPDDRDLVTRIVRRLELPAATRV